MTGKDEEAKERPEEQQNDLLGMLLRMGGSRPSIPEDVRSRVQSAVHAHWKQNLNARSQKKFLIFFSGAIAASILICVLVWQFMTRETANPVSVGIVENLQGTVLKDTKNEPLVRGGTLMSGTTLQSGETGRLLVRMLRGVSLRLDVNSRLHLKSESVYVLEQGAAYLDCNRSGGSIALVTPMGTVRDKGTQFEVRLQEGKMQIQVREGSVLLEQNGAEKTVAAGSRLIVDENGSAFFSTISSYGSDWNWISEVAPGFPMEGLSLIEFLNWVTRENGWSLQFAEPSMRDSASKVILHGSVKDLSPQQMLSAVLPVCGLTYSVENGVLAVKPGRRN
ncbi:FecR family protein [bacterium]|nr:FecR family protein [bacterium]